MPRSRHSSNSKLVFENKRLLGVHVCEAPGRAAADELDGKGGGSATSTTDAPSSAAERPTASISNARTGVASSTSGRAIATISGATACSASRSAGATGATPGIPLRTTSASKGWLRGQHSCRSAGEGTQPAAVAEAEDHTVPARSSTSYSCQGLIHFAPMLHAIDDPAIHGEWHR